MNKEEIQIIKLSASSVKTYEQCPKKYYFTYIDRQPRKEWDHLELGNFCHKVLENFHSLYLKLKSKNEVSLNRLMADAFSFAVDEFKNIKKSILKDAKILIDDYLRKIKTSGMPSVLGVEQSFTLQIAENVIVRGFLDRVDLVEQDYHILDYKTTKNPKYLDPFQLTVYGLWLKDKYPEVEKFKASYILLKHKSDTIDYNITSKDLNKTKNYLIDVANKISTDDDWRTVSSRLCSWCDFYNICPAQKTEEINDW